MIIQLIKLWILFIFYSLTLKGTNDFVNCRDRSRLIETDKGDLYAIIDAVLGQKLTLQCHYCNENDDGKPKIWYKIEDFGSSSPHEVDLDMNNNATMNKHHVNNEHSLIIRNVTENDVGLYYCLRLEENDQEKYNYLVDLVFQENVTSVETGNFTLWRKYFEEYFKPINEMFEQSKGDEFTRVRQHLDIEMELVTQWQPWSICQVCGRPQNESIKKKTGLCRLKLTHKNSATSGTPPNKDEAFLKNANAISCRSQILGRILPGISNLTQIIPNFVQIQSCEGTCNPDVEGLGKGWKVGKTSAFKYRKSLVLAQNSHLTLICPESTLENKVVWKKNGKVLTAGKSVRPENPEDAPRIIVDTFNTLYLVNVQESEEGNYTCLVDDTKMQQTIVFIISKSKILTQAFVRHMMYLGLVLSLTLPCYCAGIIVTCSRKRYFKDYHELVEIAEENKRTHNFG